MLTTKIVMDIQYQRIVTTITPMLLITTGLVPHVPATSCSNIKSNFPLLSDGLYWLDVNSSIDQYYCDMTLDDGGWTLAKRISIDSNSRRLVSKPSKLFE